MSKPPLEFMHAHGIDSDEVWEVKGSGNYAIKHAALERVAAKKAITFEPPQIATRDYANEGVCLLVVGKMGDRTEWSFGEAAPHNLFRKSDKQSIYPWAMAEKRAKDRVILKLLNAHGALYSEAEADEFAQRPNPHVVRPDDVSDARVERDQAGHMVDTIPPSVTAEPLSKMKAREDYKAIQSEIWAHSSSVELEKWGRANAKRIGMQPKDWQEIIRRTYREHMDALRDQEAADEQRMTA